MLNSMSMLISHLSKVMDTDKEKRQDYYFPPAHPQLHFLQTVLKQSPDLATIVTTMTAMSIRLLIC